MRRHLTLRKNFNDEEIDSYLTLLDALHQATSDFCEGFGRGIVVYLTD